MPGPREITTNRLTLRPPADGDRSFWVRLHGDAVADFAEARSRWERVGFDQQVIEETVTRRGIGVGGLRQAATDDGAQELTLSYRLAARAHGRGYATEAVRAWTAHAVEWLPLLPVVVRSSPADEPTVHVALRAGLEHVGIVPEGPDGAPSEVLRAPRVESPDELDPDTRTALLDLWCAVNDAGGAVGFLPGAPRHDVAGALAAHEEDMADGRTTPVLLRGAGGRVVAAGFWVADRNPLLGHARTAFRIMTDPRRRGHNLGRLLLAAMHRVARQQDVEVTVLDVRSGLGTTRFYERCGYVEVGRVPGVIRVAQGDDRDSVIMARRLDDRPLVADGRA